MKKALIIIVIFLGIFIITEGDPINFSREMKARIEMWQINKAITNFRKDTEKWPGNQKAGSVCSSHNCGNNELCQECLCSLYNDCAGLVGNSQGYFLPWNGPYIKKIPLDPWGNEYFFDTDYELNYGEETERTVAVLGSYGSNGVGINKYEEDDILLILAEE